MELKNRRFHYGNYKKVIVAEPLQNRQHAQNGTPNAVNTREQGKEGGRVR